MSEDETEALKAAADGREYMIPHVSSCVASSGPQLVSASRAVFISAVENACRSSAGAGGAAGSVACLRSTLRSTVVDLDQLVVEAAKDERFRDAEVLHQYRLSLPRLAVGVVSDYFGNYWSDLWGKVLAEFEARRYGNGVRLLVWLSARTKRPPNWL